MSEMLLVCPQGHNSSYRYFKETTKNGYLIERTTCNTCGHSFVQKSFVARHTTGPDLILVGASRFVEQWEESVSGEISPWKELAFTSDVVARGETWK